MEKKQIDGKDSYLMEFSLPTIDYKRILSDCLSLAKVEKDYEMQLKHLFLLEIVNLQQISLLMNF